MLKFSAKQLIDGNCSVDSIQFRKRSTVVMKKRSWVSLVRIAVASLVLACFGASTAHAQSSNLVVVSINPRVAETTEMALSGERMPVLLQLSRTQGLERELVVSLAYGGTATPGADYERMPEAVRFAPGSSFTNIAFFAKGDSVPETNETVIVRLIVSPTQSYLISSTEAQSLVRIIDNSTNAPGRVRILRPTEGAEFPFGQPIQISAETIDPNGYMPRVEFYAGTNRIGVAEAGFSVPAGIPITNSFMWNNAPAGPHTLTVRAKDSRQDTIVSEPIHITVVTNPPVAVTAIPAGSDWRYYNHEVAPPENWKTLQHFEWASGAAQLGYGDGDEVTVTRTNGVPHPVSAYFQRQFLSGATSGPALFRIKRDDGVVVYVNGTEILRDQMPSGVITHETTALAAAGEDENAFHEFAIENLPLRPGNNLIAVEVHQVSASSSDMSFDLELILLSEHAGLPRVTLEATVPQTSEPLPNALVVPGEFTLRRDDPRMDLPLTVQMMYSGTAQQVSPGVSPDYETMPTNVVFQPGESTVTLPVRAKSDDLAEGTEVLTARVVAFNLNVPGLYNPLIGRRPFLTDLVSKDVSILDEDKTVVSLTAVVSEAREPVPDEPPQHGRYLLSRRGNVTDELQVHLRYEGTAVADVDYAILPLTVRFAPGASSTNLLVTPFADMLVEPNETVVAYLVEPTWLPVPSYTISPTQNVATISIIDRTQVNTSSLRMLEPQDGAVFQAGQPIQVAAEAIDLLSFIPRVEFYAGTNRIGVSQIDFVQAPPPGTPLIHSTVWSNAPSGSHFLSARAVDSTGKVVVSESRFIKVGPVTERPTIALELVNNLTSELNGATDPGRFRVRRVSGPTNEPVLISFQIGGLAVNGIDYETVPSTATLPIGEMSKEFAIKALRDNLTEGLETATFVLNIPGCGVGPYPGCYNISGEGSVDIHIQDGPGYTNRPPIVTVTAPIEGAVYEEGQVIEVRAEGTDIDGHVVRMEAMIDHKVIASTNGPVIVGRTNAAPGAHTIFVSATDNAGAFGFSRAVQITVRPMNAVATIVLNEPEEGEVFAAGQRIELAAEAIDPFGHIARLEFYTGTNRIGVSEIPASQLPAVGLPVHHSMVWSNAPAGTHRLSARALDSRGNMIVSEPVTIRVDSVVAIPIVGVRFQPEFSTEPWPLADRANGSFDFYRTGNLAEPLMVLFDRGGTATPGADYVSFNTYIVFAGGQSRTNLRVNAVDDTLVEPHETVIVQLKPAPLGIDSPYPTGYVIDPTNVSATVVIVDNDTNIGPARINIIRPENGATFPVGQPITVEAVAIDPAGYIPRVEFFSGTTRIGVSEKHFIVPPPPGTPITHSIVWSNAPAGEHNLVARGLDSGRRIVVSPAVQIRVGTQESVLLTLEVLDSLASETPVNGAINSALFRIRQVSGPTNEPIHAWVTMSGTANNGIDYQGVNMILPFPTNRTYLDVRISPLQDDLVEGEETVFLTLNPSNCGGTNGISLLPFVPLPSCYGIIGTNMGRAVILDAATSSNRPPTVAITSPLDGAVFAQGQRVEVQARASDPDGFISVLELGMDGRLIGFTNGPAHTVWTNPPVGEHTFVAIATDNLGAKRESAPVRILVRETNNISFAQRQLPAGYIPEIWFIVRIQVNVPAGTQAWGLEDHPPQGWAVSAISDGGVYDPATGKVKFGHFVEGGTRTLTYSVRPPLGASGTVEFSGIISLDGRTYPIGGHRTISRVASEYHPADVNRDRRIILAEVTGYAAAWKRGTNWPSGPNPIPAAYVTHAAMIWRHGEVYTFVATNLPPKCWVPAAGVVRALANASSAIRTIQDGEDFAVITLQVQPGAGFGAYTVEEQVPIGWTVLNPSSDGVFDAANRVIRWGLYMDGEPRTLNYSLVPATGTSISAQLTGEVTLDGEAVAFIGDASVIAHAETELSLPATEIAADGSVKFRLAGEAGQVCDLESSTDLVNWTFVTELFLPEGRLEYIDYNADQTSQRYYRLKAR